MSKIKFRVGPIVFNLPSRAVGDSSTCIGRVSINVPSLNCSNSLSFDKDDLVKFHQESTSLYQSLKGYASIKSKCTMFNLLISGTSKGHMKFEVFMSHFKFASPENSDWQTKMCFYTEPDSLLQLIKNKDEIYS